MMKGYKMVEKYTLGIDIGTTGVKASVLDVDKGMVVAHSLKEHPLFHPKPGYAEQEGDNYWKAVVEAVKECFKQGPYGEKIAGVLIENQIKLSVIKSSIIGIGLNVNQIHFEDFIATSVKKKTGKFESINDFLYVFIHSFNKVWNQYFHQVNLLDREYFNYLYLKDVKSNYKDNSGVFSGIIRGVKSSGKLLIEKDNTRIEYGMKEIEFI